MSQVLVAQNFLQGLRVQGRVIWALMLRETKTMYGRSRFGYLWVIIQTVFSISVFWGLREVLSSAQPYGIPIPMFLLCGFTSWNIFSDTLTKVGASVSANQALLFYSKVRHMDLMVARMLLVVATNMMVLILLASMVYLVGYKYNIASLWPLVISWFYLAILGFGAGALLCALLRFSEGIMVIVSMALRIGFLVSGVIFSYTQLPVMFEPLAQYNPFFQLVEYSRMSFSYTYPGDIMNFELVIMCAIVIPFLGLVTEYVTRGKESLV